MAKWTSRDCLDYSPSGDEDCYRVTDGWCAGIDVLPRGGKLSAAYNGNALKTMAKVKEQIMLTGGVITSMALPWADFERFTAYKQGVFLAMNELQPGTEGVMHAVFCYGWWDDPRSSSDGYWLCKNSLSTKWGINGTFKMAYMHLATSCSPTTPLQCSLPRQTLQPAPDKSSSGSSRHHMCTIPLHLAVCCTTLSSHCGL